MPLPKMYKLQGGSQPGDPEKVQADAAEGEGETDRDVAVVGAEREHDRAGVRAATNHHRQARPPQVIGGGVDRIVRLLTKSGLNKPLQQRVAKGKFLLSSCAVIKVLLVCSG